MCLFAFCQLILFAKVQEVSIISLYLLVIIYTVIYLASHNVSLRFLSTHFICKGAGSFNNLIIPISYYLHCNLHCFTQWVSLPAHFICKAPGSFHYFIIPISYYLQCNLSCFTQCVSSSFTNSFYLQRSRKFPLFIIPISYCLHCNLSCFTQCVSSSFTNSFHFQRSREFPFFHVIYVVCKMQNCFKFPQGKLAHVRHTLA